ncbi:hypothetical protein EV1_008378 [Malus domestica]
MAEVSSRQPSWEVEFDALLSSTSRAAGHSATTTEPTELAIFVRLQAVLSLLASQVLERKGLDLLDACLNDLGSDGQLSAKAIVQTSSALE